MPDASPKREHVRPKGRAHKEKSGSSPKTMLRFKSAPRKSPFYKKKSAMKTEKLMDKYAQLQRTGKLDGFLRKRREKRASKGQKYLPKKVT
mmetsp:Transcript_5147/g.19953  ORF Transcript_5147/g.19953 Transcript_5147/m.19953 type:complete len:91 (-) Transcript_5147:987-1259(-)